MVSLQLRSDEVGSGATELVPVLRALATSYKALGEFEKEKSVLRQAYSIQEHDPAEARDSPRLIYTLTMLARTYADLEEFERALATLERVLQIKRARYDTHTHTHSHTQVCC